MDYLSEKVKNFINNKIKNKKILNELLLNITYNDEKIVNCINIEFERKNIKYHKNSNILIASFMKTNFNNDNIIQLFSDVTYYVTPTFIKKNKIFTILGFDIKEVKTKLWCIALIQNENYETFGSIFLYLKDKYQFTPKYITSDFNSGFIKAISYVYPDCIFIPCYFHFINNCVKRLSQLKKNGEIQEKAKNLLANIKILCFIKITDV